MLIAAGKRVVFSAQISIFAAHILIRRDGHTHSIGGLAESVWLRDHLLGHPQPPLIKHSHSHTHTLATCNSQSTKRRRRGWKWWELGSEPSLYCIPSSATTPAVSLPSQLKRCSHDLWPGNSMAGEKVISVWVLVLKAKRPGVDGVYTSRKKKKPRAAEENMRERCARALYIALSKRVRRCPLISVFDHMAVVGEQTVHGCLLCLSAVL